MNLGQISHFEKRLISENNLGEISQCDGKKVMKIRYDF